MSFFAEFLPKQKISKFAIHETTPSPPTPNAGVVALIPAAIGLPNRIYH
jgi:hypothetical protein